MHILTFVPMCILYYVSPFQLGSTAVGICTSEGVVLAVEKRITSSLMEPSSIEKILEIDSHIGRPPPPQLENEASFEMRTSQ